MTFKKDEASSYVQNGTSSANGCPQRSERIRLKEKAKKQIQMNQIQNTVQYGVEKSDKSHTASHSKNFAIGNNTCLEHDFSGYQQPRIKELDHNQLVHDLRNQEDDSSE